MKHQQIMKWVILGVVVILGTWVIYNTLVVPYRLKLPREIDGMFLQNGNNGESIMITDVGQQEQLIDVVDDLKLKRVRKKESSTGWHIAIVVEAKGKNQRYVVTSQEIIHENYIYRNSDTEKQLADLYTALCEAFQ
ncbi:MAG: hypothetical protein IJN16_06985 [Lachnospiraceae bacterium]|nr:hypothetical protein [Lachnospiraceae bacterium]